MARGKRGNPYNINVRLHMEERTTRELIEKLGGDVERCQKMLMEAIDQGEVDEEGNVSADYEFHARNLIRSIIAYIEAVTYSVKVHSVDKCMKAGISVSDHERYLAVEIDGALNDKGEIIERPSKIRLSSNVRFAFNLYEKASGEKIKFDPGDEWWTCFKETMRVRDRLTHPRLPDDIDITGKEIANAIKAWTGYEKVLLDVE